MFLLEKIVRRVIVMKIWNMAMSQIDYQQQLQSKVDNIYDLIL